MDVKQLEEVLLAVREMETGVRQVMLKAKSLMGKSELLVSGAQAIGEELEMMVTEAKGGNTSATDDDEEEAISEEEAAAASGNVGNETGDGWKPVA